MALEDLKRRFGPEVDVDGAWADYLRNGGGSGSVDGFLAYMRGRELISSQQFIEHHGGDEIAVARLVGVRKDKTLVLEHGPVQARTLIASVSQGKTLVPSPAQPTLIADASGGSSPAPPLPTEIRASRYALLGCLGKGAMGEVHVARDEDLMRKVAFKKMVPEVAQSRALAARFFSEIQVTAQLDHPHIVPIYGLEVSEGNNLGYSMKLVQGKTLAAIIEEHRAEGPAGEVKRLAARLEIFLKVCDGIAYAHSKGVLHRDLKPENIMVGRYNEVYVMDWGICRVIGNPDPTADEIADAAQVTSASQRTQYGAVLGTPAYMSPEQAMGKNPELDGRSDQYALGLILHELASLKGAQQGDSLEEVLGRAREGVKDPLHHVHAHLPIARELRAIVARATVIDPAGRYPSVSALAEDVRRYLRGEEVTAQPDNALQRAARFVGRHRAASLASLLGIVVLGAAATIGVLVRGDRALERARLHEERVEALLVATGERAHVIDNHFYRFEGLLDTLAGRAREALARSRANPGERPVYFDEDYRDAARRPADSADSAFYHMPISLDHIAIKRAPDVAADAVAGDARLLESLQPALAGAVFGSATDNDSRDGDEAAARIRRDGVPILRSFVTLATGVHASYPGSGGFAADYDGRKRPKYVLAAGKHGTHWGNPYKDQRHGRGMLLPVSVALYAPDGSLEGVAGLDATFSYIGKQLLGLPDVAAVDHAYLVDDQSRVVIEWDRQGGVKEPAVDQAEADQAIPLAAYPDAAVARSFTEKTSGLVERGDRVVVWERLASLGWTYVVVADRARLLSASR